MFLWDTIIRRLIRIKDTIEALKVPKSNPPLVIGFVKKITKCGAKGRVNMKAIQKRIM
jgi:hypothetical protein